MLGKKKNNREGRRLKKHKMLILACSTVCLRERSRGSVRVCKDYLLSQENRDILQLPRLSFNSV